MKHTIILSLLACAAISAPAATISWTGSAATVDTGDSGILNPGLFDTSGTFLSAANLGGTLITFDGIDFGGADTVSADAISFVGGSISATGLGTYDGFHDAAADLSKTGVYGDAGALGTVSLTGLTIGNAYRIQALIYDGRGDPGIPGRTVHFDGVNQGQYANGTSGVTWGDGLLVTGTFTADAATQSFTVEAFDGASSVGTQLNALSVFQTTAIPEPSTYGMMGAGALAGVALVRRRRK